MFKTAVCLRRLISVRETRRFWGDDDVVARLILHEHDDGVQTSLEARFEDCHSIGGSQNWPSPGIGGGKDVEAARNSSCGDVAAARNLRLQGFWSLQEIGGNLDLRAAGTGHSGDSLGDANDDAQSSVSLGVVSPPYSF